MRRSVPFIAFLSEAFLSLLSSLRHLGIDWDSRKKRKAIFRITGPGKHEGWSERVDNELGNYDYLLGEHTFSLLCVSISYEAQV